MITIKNAQTLDGQLKTLTIASAANQLIHAEHLTLLPGLIDPHVHFRTPGMEYKEDWRTAAKASIYGGYTTVFDMPNTLPPTITAELLQEKQRIIDAQLAEAQIPLRYHLFFGADKNHLAEIPKVKNQVIGIKVFMGCSTGNLVIDDDESLHAVFKIAAENDMLVAVHAEDETMMRQNKIKYAAEKDYAIHSKIRNPEVAACAVKKALDLTRLYGTRLYILHVSTLDEIKLIQAAKTAGLPVFAETTPHHLFVNESAYAAWRGKVVMNPPIRSSEHQDALFAAIRDGIIDTLGTDHAPHTLDEKAQPYGQCPSGVPGIETALPLLLNAHHEGLISLAKIVSLTSARARAIFQLAENNDYVLVDLNLEKTVSDAALHSKCKWSPFNGRLLKGWPVYTVLRGKLFKLDK